jgi:CheY-like chemotaxis protein
MNSPTESKAHRILVITDDPTLYTELRRILSTGDPKGNGAGSARPAFATGTAPAAGRREFSLDLASSGEAAQQLVQQAIAGGHPYSVAFAPVRVPPGWNGLETAAKLWQVDPDLQFVLCTAGAEIPPGGTARFYASSERLPTLQRPFEPAQLLHVSRSLAERSRLLHQIRKLRLANELLRAEADDCHCDAAPQQSVEIGKFRAATLQAFSLLLSQWAGQLNQLLAGIQSEADMLRRAPSAADDPTDSLGAITRAVEQAYQLARPLPALGRTYPVAPQELDLNRALTELAPTLAQLLGDSICLETELAHGPLVLLADPGLLEQFFVSFALHARQAMPLGGRWVLSTSPLTVVDECDPLHAKLEPGEYVLLRVRDSGNGIGPERLPFLLDPLASGAAPEAGIPVELATVRAIAEQHQGTLEAISTANAGMIYEVFFPRVTGPAAVCTTAAPPKPAVVVAQTILLVDDDESIRKLVRCQLEAQGYCVHEAEDSAAALRVWEQRHESVDLLMTDLVMPGVTDGKQLADRLRAEKPGLKVILTTGFGEMALGNELGVDAGTRFLPKPYQLDGLLRTVQDCLSVN